MVTPSEDPIRAEVERALNIIVDLTVRTPVRIMTFVPRCLLRRAARVGPLAEPVRVIRSLVELAGTGTRGVVTPDDAPAPNEPALAAATSAGAARRGAGARLPIEDYESLAASHVVDRLPTLTPRELRAVQAFEAEHRGRRTVLGRIEQLLG